MKSLLKGLASFPHILTEEDVLRHSYGVGPDGTPVAPELEAEEPIVAEEPAPAPVEPAPAPEAPAPEPSPEPVAPEPEAAPISDAAPSDDQLSDAEFAEKLERENTKAVLVSMAEAAGLDSTGNKAELSARLVAHYRSK